MIIGNSFAGTTFARSSNAHKIGEDGSRARDSASPVNNDAAAPGAGQSAYRFNSYGSQHAASSLDSEGALSMQQTARIVAQIAFRQQVDDVSAYALLGTPDQDTDQFRQVAASYGDNAD